MTDAAREPATDVCFLLEGTYPYVSGGVSSWVHDLVGGLGDLRFEIVALLPDRKPREAKYKMPANIAGIRHVYMGDLDPGWPWLPDLARVFRRMEPHLDRIQRGAGLEDLRALNAIMAPHRRRLGSRILFDSMPAWDGLKRLYESSLSRSPFLEFYWTWRSLIGGLYAVLTAELPPAKVYHSVSTGYAGAMAARAAVETGASALVTEHGIYTNERRIEITMADWIYDTPPGSLSVEDMPRSLKDMWKDTFASYSLACYEACDRVLTIFGGNQRFQRNDGADPAKMRVIPNGVDVAKFSAIRRRQGNYPPTVALIGRVVSIKDVKTFIRACGLLQQRVPTLRALVMGPYEEEKDYAEECRALVHQSGLDATVAFTGRVDITKYFPEIDIVVLTSISEGQPLVILEAGAAGIPAVATDVGACREIIEGHADEAPRLGHGGIVTAVASPKATAEAMHRLLGNAEFYTACSRAIRERVRRSYDKRDMLAAYRDEYAAAAQRTREGTTIGARIGQWRESASR